MGEPEQFRRFISVEDMHKNPEKIDTSAEHVQKSELFTHNAIHVGSRRSSDPVNHPSHYASGEIECIDAIKASMSHEAFLGYLKGNVQKYIWRYEKKLNPVQDLDKASWYLSRLIQEL